MSSESDPSFLKIGILFPAIVLFYPVTWIFHFIMTLIFLLIGYAFEIIYGIDHLIMISLSASLIFILIFNIFCFNFEQIESKEYKFHNIKYRDAIVSFVFLAIITAMIFSGYQPKNGTFFGYFSAWVGLWLWAGVTQIQWALQKLLGKK
jgi:energy-coupling factor transporter transmembrane protein EcfT